MHHSLGQQKAAAALVMKKRVTSDVQSVSCRTQRAPRELIVSEQRQTLCRVAAAPIENDKFLLHRDSIVAIATSKQFAVCIVRPRVYISCTPVCIEVFQLANLSHTVHPGAVSALI